MIRRKNPTRTGPTPSAQGSHHPTADRVPATDILAREGWAALPGVQSPCHRAQHRLGWMWSR